MQSQPVFFHVLANQLPRYPSMYADSFRKVYVEESPGTREAHTRERQVWGASTRLRARANQMGKTPGAGGSHTHTGRQD
jgi:hypothetical protein